jgi:hypothetical protein
VSTTKVLLNIVIVIGESLNSMFSNTLLMAALIAIYGDEVRFRCSRLSQNNEDLATNRPKLSQNNYHPSEFLILDSIS